MNKLLLAALLSMTMVQPANAGFLTNIGEYHAYHRGLYLPGMAIAVVTHLPAFALGYLAKAIDRKLAKRAGVVVTADAL